MSELPGATPPGSMLFDTEELAPPRRALPEPSAPRFQPLRAGILNLWQYDDQEFVFHRGRLILRGENGTGKSKALELLLPFLLDADLSPHRLDPFAGTARTMRWNLLEGDRHESRVGYAWLEFGRLDEAGEPVYVTLGAGLKATRRSSRVDSWYFVTPRRVGASLELVTPARKPLLREQLRQALDGEGEIYQQGAEYRERVDRELFGLKRDRFSALRHLLLQLRRPQLSEKLDPRSLSELLIESLPPIDEDLVGQLSQGFERLERDQAELRRIEAAAEAVEGFREVYREYCRGIARARAAGMRTSDSRYHREAASLRTAEEEYRASEAAIAELEVRHRETEGAINEGRGRLQALDRSEAMRAARALQEKEGHTRTLTENETRDSADATRAERQADGRRRDHEAARERTREAKEAVGVPAERALSAAGSAGLEAMHRSAAEMLRGDPETAHGSVKGALAERRRSLEELRLRVAERDRLSQLHDQAEELRREADARSRDAAERTSKARRGLESEREALDAALLRWAEDLTELELDEATLETLRSSALESDDRGELERRVAALAAPRREALVRRRFETESERSRIAEELEETEAERRRVEAARELGPEPPRTRAAEREGRSGAPFYLLCDFAQDLGAAERAGLEAALEGSGLLDAWVMPDGRLLDPETLDTVLAPSPRSGGGTLTEVLVAEPGHGVGAEAIEALLESLRLGAPEDEADAPWVSTDGHWRLGPLHGAWAKDTAEHLGAAAREAARQRRLEELAECARELGERLAELDSALGELSRRLERLSAEESSLPSTAALDRAAQRLEAAEEDESRRRAELEEAEKAAAAARRELEAAAAELRRRAEELHLAAELDDLDAYRQRLDAYRDAFEELARAAEAARRAAEAETRSRDLAREADEQAEELRRRARESEELAVRARAELEELRQTSGAEAEEIVERYGRVEKELEELERRLAEIDETRGAQREDRARLEERCKNLRHELEEREAKREEAAERLRRFAELGLLPLVLEGLEAEEPGNWSITRTLETARAIEQACAAVELEGEAPNRRATRMYEHYQELGRDLGGEFQPSFLVDDDLQVVSVLHQQTTYDVPRLLDMLRREAATRRELLDEAERELLERFLLSEVGDHLRSRLRRAHELVARMNQRLAELKTASGMALRLSWRPDPELEGDVRRTLELLRRDVEMLSDADRAELEEFFRRRIDAARESAEAVPWRDHLLSALDYRRWHVFRVQRQVSGETEWRELTRRGHAASSGGEKSVALHLPLFAAASAHYDSAQESAPRLIMLDEAFAGIDQGMRGRCMGLLVDFDLDFMMTSHDEWGCYRELSGVSTYQLYRDPTLGGVAAIRFVWDGRELQQEEG